MNLWALAPVKGGMHNGSYSRQRLDHVSALSDARPRQNGERRVGSARSDGVLGQNTLRTIGEVPIGEPGPALLRWACLAV